MNITFKILIGLVALALLGYGAMIVTDPSKNIVITEYTFSTTDTGEKIIVGSVKNTTNNTYTNVKVDISVLDETDAELGTSFVTKETLSPGEVWSFKSQPVPGGSEGFRIEVNSPDNVRPTWLGGCAKTFCWMR